MKTAIHGGDPNWGRLIAVAGRAGVDVRARRAPRCTIGSIVLFKDGRPHDERGAAGGGVSEGHGDHASTSISAPGSASSTVWTCDLSAEYVRINADYRT